MTNVHDMSRSELIVLWTRTARQLDSCSAKLRELQEASRQATLKNELLAKVQATPPPSR